MLRIDVNSKYIRRIFMVLELYFIIYLFMYWRNCRCVRLNWVALTLSKRPNRVGDSFPSPEDGNRSSFLNVVFSSIYSSERWTKYRNPGILNCSHVLLNVNNRGTSSLAVFRGRTSVSAHALSCSLHVMCLCMYVPVPTRCIETVLINRHGINNVVRAFFVELMCFRVALFRP
jgi:hypothetical protein